MAYRDLIRWVQEKTGMNEIDACLFVSHNAQVTVAQIVDPQYTVLAKLPKDRLPPARWIAVKGVERPASTSLLFTRQPLQPYP